MKILRVHIGKTVIFATLFVLLMLIGLQLFVTFIAQLGDIGKGDYGLWQALLYVGLTLPASVYSFFPMAGLVGCLLGLGYLATSNELVVMRAAGVSVGQVTWSVIQAAILLLIVMTIAGELVGPSAVHFANQQKAVAKSGGQALSTQHGVWARDHDTFIHINSVVSGTLLLGVTQYQFGDDHKLNVASYAKQAQYQNDVWQLTNVIKTHFGSDSTETESVEQEVWPVKLKPDLFKLSSDDPSEISLARLINLIHYRRSNGLDTQAYALAFWQRVMQPVSTLVMILLAIPFIFGPLRSVSMGLRIVAGIAVSFLFYLLNRFFGPVSLVYQIPPFWGAAFPSILFLGIGLFFMRRVR